MTNLTKEKREKTRVEIARSRQGLVMVTGEDMMAPPSLLGGSPSLLNIISRPALRSPGRCQLFRCLTKLKTPCQPHGNSEMKYLVCHVCFKAPST